MKRSAELGKFLNPPAHYLSMNCLPIIHFNCLPIIHFNVVKEDVKQAFLNWSKMLWLAEEQKKKAEEEKRKADEVRMRLVAEKEDLEIELRRAQSIVSLFFEMIKQITRKWKLLFFFR